MADEQPLRAGETVLLVDERRGHRHLTVPRPGPAFHSDRGVLPHDALIGAPHGSTVTTALGARYLVLRPTLALSGPAEPTSLSQIPPCRQRSP